LSQRDRVCRMSAIRNLITLPNFELERKAVCYHESRVFRELMPNRKFGVVFSIAVTGMFVYCGVSAQNHPKSTQPSSRSVWDGVYSDEQAKRGGDVYSSDCSSCHGKTLGGIDDAPPLAGKEFMEGWDKGTLGNLFGKISRTMPRNAAGRLSA